MNIHKLARTTPASRALIASRRAAGLQRVGRRRALGVDRKTVRKWTRRQQMEGVPGFVIGRPAIEEPDGTRFGVEGCCAGTSAAQVHPGRDRPSAQADDLTDPARRFPDGSEAQSPRAAGSDNRYERSRPGETGARRNEEARALLIAQGIAYGRPPTKVSAASRLGVCARRDRRLLALGLRRAPGDEKGVTFAGFLQRAAALFARHGVQTHRTRPQRQRLGLYLGRFATPSLAGRAAHPYPAVHPAHQWQGRALHPDHAAPLGLRQALQPLRRTGRRSRPLALWYNRQRPTRLPSRPQPRRDA